jgi:hypothetical protein
VEHDDIATFRLPGRCQIGLLVIVMIPSCARVVVALYFGMSISFVLIEAAALALAWTLLLRLNRVQLRQDGVKIQSLWWLPWTDVSAVVYRKLFGLPYFHVKRHGGFSWWIPLYYVGDGDLGRAIVRCAPPGHPFRLVSMPL